MVFEKISAFLDDKAVKFAGNVQKISGASSATVIAYPEHLGRKLGDSNTVDVLWNYSLDFEGDLYFVTDDEQIPSNRGRILDSAEEMVELGDDYSEFYFGGLENQFKTAAEELQQQYPNSMVYRLDDLTLPVEGSPSPENNWGRSVYRP